MRAGARFRHEGRERPQLARINVLSQRQARSSRLARSEHARRVPAHAGGKTATQAATGLTHPGTSRHLLDVWCCVVSTNRSTGDRDESSTDQKVGSSNLSGRAGYVPRNCGGHAGFAHEPATGTNAHVADDRYCEEGCCRNSLAALIRISAEMIIWGRYSDHDETYPRASP